MRSTRAAGARCEKGLSGQDLRLLRGTGDQLHKRPCHPSPICPREPSANLPQVPACAACNNAKSADEHYLATVLPFGGNHLASSAILELDVPRRLAKNQRLHRELAASQTDIWLNLGGGIESTIGFSIEADRVVRYARWMIQGLHAHHWEPVPKGTWVGAGVLTPAGQKFQLGFMNMGGLRLRGDIGHGLFSYAALRSFEKPYISAWWLRLFGGVMLGGDPNVPGFASLDLFGLIGPRPTPELFADVG